MSESKLSKAKIEELKQLGSNHQWWAVCALKEIFSNEQGQNRAGTIDWVALSRAAYHAGAARIIHDIRNIVE